MDRTLAPHDPHQRFSVAYTSGAFHHQAEHFFFLSRHADGDMADGYTVMSPVETNDATIFTHGSSGVFNTHNVASVNGLSQWRKPGARAL
ncbi:protein of unknown function [Paraburkholderia dioscoreae]|uniref:Uncharacterized protein n=1 Tax=Paraburkholderia dioscoreae TaxID=2604047 RepID=A0A5Q4ZJX9_9BURK|nr:protein of unknown function [Paraburkholderia dioscoreae]